MSRRRQSPADSLELLLDTICNTFGGVLFIAILVVILLRLSGDSAREAARKTAVPAASLAQRRFEETLLHERRDGLRERAAAQRELLLQLVPADLESLVAERDEERSRLDQLASEMSRLQQQLLNQEQDQNGLDEAVRETRGRLEAALAANEAASQDLEKRRGELRRELRTSVVRSPGSKRQVVVVLEYGRMYVWHHYDAAGVRRGLNTEEFLVLDSGVGGVETTPNPQAGIAVEGSDESRRLLAARLAAFRPSRDYLAIIVRPDSYEAFQHFRDVLVTRGFEYELVPATADGAFRDRGGSGGRVQ